MSNPLPDELPPNFDFGGYVIHACIGRGGMARVYRAERPFTMHRNTHERIAPSVGSRGDSYDNALAESGIGLFKTEIIHPRGPWRTRAAI